ncbi:MAG: polymorphic toxin type 23 domain-containing protein [Vicingaceae bacterium]|nr:polymorphic toxin type 23 domain-containing protein [Vicingaceae bacterium]
MSKHIIIVCIAIIFCFQTVNAQQYQEGKVGVNVGVVFAIGTHIDRFGGVINAYYKTNNFQINPELRVYFNGKNLGPNKPSIETVLSLGTVYSYGSLDTINNDFYSPVANQTQHQNSFGYAYRFYFNNIKTSQRTGLISIEVSNFNLIAENDLFAEPKLDRYRTGAFLLQYQKDNYQFAINSTLFTGQMGERVTDESYPFNHIYENTKGGKYTEFSHGLLSAQFKYVDEFYQTYQANIGIDAERVRHVVQNRLIHDILVLPKLTGNINAHIPMLADKGGQYLFKENQKVKPMQFYMNGFMSPSLFY